MKKQKRIHPFNLTVLLALALAAFALSSCWVFDDHHGGHHGHSSGGGYYGGGHGGHGGHH